MSVITCSSTKESRHFWCRTFPDLSLRSSWSVSKKRFTGWQRGDPVATFSDQIVETCAYYKTVTFSIFTTSMPAYQTCSISSGMAIALFQRTFLGEKGRFVQLVRGDALLLTSRQRIRTAMHAPR